MTLTGCLMLIAFMTLVCNYGLVSGLLEFLHPPQIQYINSIGGQVLYVFL